ncbi:MAG: hypothetical protein AAF517_06745, partial [Planctomycetota bacterium]
MRGWILRALALAILTLLPSISYAQFPISQDFRSTTAPGWVFGDDAALTAVSGADTDGDGWLRLTPNSTFSKGFAFFDTAFPTSEGVSFEFVFSTWGGTGADGITFFLFDGSIDSSSFSTGDFGGSLGYANGCAPDEGMTGGYLGIGFDEFGNFSNPSDRCKSGGPGQIPNSIAVRGSGSGFAGYAYLTGTATLSDNLDFPGVGTRPDQSGTSFRQVNIDITPDQRLTVRMKFGADADSVTLIDNFDLSSAAGQDALPSTLKLGFAGSTGLATNNHDVRLLEIAKPSNLSVSIDDGNAVLNAGSAISYTAVVNNDGPNDIDGASFQTVVPPEITNVTWTCSVTDGSGCSAENGTGNNVTNFLELLEGGAATFTISGVVSPTASGGTLQTPATITVPIDYLDGDETNNSDTDDTVIFADADGDGIQNDTDLDDDNDGIPDIDEGAGDTDNDGIPDQFDIDSDNDGIVDILEAGGADADEDGRVDGFVDANNDGLDDTIAATPLPQPDFDADGLDDRVDIDSDDDGIVDNVEALPFGPTYEAPTGVDSDSDGLDDAYDADSGGTYIVPVDTDGTDGPDYVDLDADGDTVPDLTEGHDADSNGVADRTPAGTDSDGDGLDDNFDTIVDPADGNVTGSNAPLQNTDGAGDPDWRDVDDDGDGTLTINEDANGNDDPRDDDSDTDTTPDYLDNDDHDADGIPDGIDLDDDNDGIPDALEAAGDTDGDGVLDVFDLDSDGDGIPDIIEAGGAESDNDGRVDGFTDVNNDGLDDDIAASPLPRPDSDADGNTDWLDIDSDDDGIVDSIEAQATGAGFISPLNVDVDADGLDDAYDVTTGGVAIIPVDTDGVGEPDYLDLDSDGDTVPDAIEGHDDDQDGIADRSPSGVDSDGDGLDDAFDTVVSPAGGNALGSNAPLQDTDFDDIKDWRDVDDDDDGTNTIDEDADGNDDPTNDDGDNDGTPDYLEGELGDVIFLKSATTNNPGELEAGDEITYSLVIQINDGNPLVSAIAIDSIPPNTTYVQGSTTLNGASVSDVDGVSPVISGLFVSSSG